MDIIYSFHAKKRLKERDIKVEEVKETIDFPDYTIKRKEEIEAYKRFTNILLKVVYIKKENYIKIITVYPLDKNEN
ncbi:MAG: DUF4258 domain-containing protein [archaeon]